MKRKSLTISREIYNALKSFSDPADRAAIYDAIFEDLFEGIQTSRNNLTDTQKMAYVVLAPQIRKMTMQFENGKQGGRKNDAIAPSILKCSHKKTQLQPNYNPTITQKLKKESKKYIPFKKYNIIYKYNTLHLLTLYHVRAHEKSIKKTTTTTPVVTTKKITTTEQEVVTRTRNILHRLAAGPEQVNICGAAHASSEIIERIQKFYAGPGALDKIKSIYADVDTNPDIRNPYKYTVSRLYNVACGLVVVHKNNYTNKTADEKSGIITHRYTQEDFDNLYDSLDEFCDDLDIK
ncbi:MAG: hypothetical protein IJ542_02650 [Clostridia bacterium]|nr:hypothetical protein [Clostridia bacterium]